MSSMKTKAGATPTYWRSLDHLADTPEFRTFVEREFPSIAEEMDTPATRRTFLKIMGASMALAGVVVSKPTARKKGLPSPARISRSSMAFSANIPSLYA